MQMTECRRTAARASKSISSIDPPTKRVLISKKPRLLFLRIQEEGAAAFCCW
ncbi:hypothetical protein CLOBOL_02492 [Enterocloster bolteae ATCC BAA-613]|uniref:Uncharacterized protein n=1 Tax=Enterocloster bolteae (strain ATCC BAA-613 / DSM 15670 / CCUG 46953 / JCM 12243 / WAL 16351) TaxID=411902 RepID=A8RPK0_ENTBW|nr:hypothetical protein CLOBOL_02492 [Enterocloster bolteae ATCC BAA-613]